MTIGELFIELGFKADTMKLKDFMKAVGELNMSSIASALGLGVLYDATNKIMNIADGAAMSIWGFSQTTGIGTKEAQQFSAVVEQLGGSAEDAKGSLKNLQTAMFNVKWGQGNIAPFQAMQIDPRKGVFEALAKIQEFVKSPKYTDEFKRMMIEAIGLSDSLIPVLKNTKDITEAMKAQEISAEKQIETMVQFHQVNKKLGQELGLIWMDLATIIEPVIEMIEKVLTLILRLFDNILSGKKNLAASLGTGSKQFLNWLLPFLPEDFPEKLGDYINPFKEKSIEDVLKPFDFLLKPPATQMAGSTTYGDTTIKVDVSGTSDPIKAAEEAAKKINKMLSDRFYHQGTQKR
jgi:hypothetical protein